MPHKMVHVVSVHNHCIEFMVVVDPCGYFNGSQHHVMKRSQLQ